MHNGNEVPPSTKSTLLDYLKPTGTVGRGTYALVGCLGFALKHNLDRQVAANFFSWQVPRASPRVALARFRRNRLTSWHATSTITDLPVAAPIST
jgi:hypothetical protein